MASSPGKTMVRFRSGTATKVLLFSLYNLQQKIKTAIHFLSAVLVGNPDKGAAREQNAAVLSLQLITATAPCMIPYEVTPL